MLDCLYAFHFQPLPKGDRVGIISGPGGIAVTTTDACLEMGMSVPQFSKGTAGKLLASMPLVGGSVANPIDLSLASVVGPHVYRDAIRMLLEEKNVDMLLVISATEGARLRDLMLEAAHGLDAKKPVAVAVMAGTSDAVARDCRLLLDAGIPAYPDALRAAKALCRTWEYAQFLKRARDRTDEKLKSAGRRRSKGAAKDTRAIIEKAAREGRHRLSGHESAQVLRAYGIPVAREVEVSGERPLRQACAEIGFPVAIKAAWPDASHKTDLGLVRLNVRNMKEAVSAFRQIAAGRKGVEKDVLVQEMVGGARELIAGLIRDPLFGPCVMVGMGGVFSDVMADRSFRPAAVDAAEALDMIGELKGRAILGPFRGMPACDLDRIADVIVRLGKIGCEQPDIAELDINPLIISGAAPVAVDAIIVLDGVK